MMINEVLRRKTSDALRQHVLVSWMGRIDGRWMAMTCTSSGQKGSVLPQSDSCGFPRKADGCGQSRVYGGCSASIPDVHASFTDSTCLQLTVHDAVAYGNRLATSWITTQQQVFRLAGEHEYAATAQMQIPR